MATTRSLFLGIAVLLLSCVILTDVTYGQRRHGPPPWAPAHGYRAKARHIYFPQHNMYFDLQRGVYIYMSGSTWEVGAKLPVRLQHVDLGSCTKIELDIDSDTPQRFNHDHRLRYLASSESSTVERQPSHGKGKKKK